MPTVVIANVYRITFEFRTTSGQKAVNVMHVRAPSTTEAAIATRLGVIATGWVTANNPFTYLPNTYSLFGGIVLPLDGVTAGTPWSYTGSTGGQSSGDPIPMAATVLSLLTGVRGPKGRGRLYVGPITEGQNNNGEFDPTSQTTFLTRWNTFFNALQSGSPSMQPVVASYKHAVANDVVAIRVDDREGVQRRRNDRLR